MRNLDGWIVVGRFGRPHGVKGFVTVHSFTEPRDNILQYEDWYIFLNNQWQSIKLSDIELLNKSIIAKVQGFPEREMVAQLTNIDIGIPQEKLENLQAGEYYWHQLIGLDVVNLSGEKLGQVAELIATGSNDVLVVTGKKRCLIPYLPERYVLEINLEQQKIVVDWDADF
ncbi:MAG: 16S rRNA processing protein RimM [Legionella sp. 40-6]|nr:ribosome maturation factor RimM [Legionella sp.]OJY40335.1 MAG: 16S rRNA processing protein RimM [Legionella sp. 40-6]